MYEYREEGHPTEKLHLTEEEYLRVHQSWVKYCHDVVVVGPDGAFYLGVRNKTKMEPGPWMLGGAVRPFTSLLDSLVAVIKRETGITFAQERFTHVRLNRYWFSGHEGAGVPHDALCEIYAIKLTENELASVQLDPLEYDPLTLIRYDRDALGTIPNAFTRQILLDLWNEKDSWHLA